jgi:hypothetical protein
MKLTSGVVALAITVGTGWAQNPNVITNTKTTLQQVQQKGAAEASRSFQPGARRACQAGSCG